MMNTRCPHCGTAFRVKPEQLRARAGRVRCGHCQAPFNALEHLFEASAVEAEDSVATASPTPTHTAPAARSADGPQSDSVANAPEALAASKPLNAAAMPAPAPIPAPAPVPAPVSTPVETPASDFADQATWIAPGAHLDRFASRSNIEPPRYQPTSFGRDIAPPLPELEPGAQSTGLGGGLDFDLGEEPEAPAPTSSLADGRVEPRAEPTPTWQWQDGDEAGDEELSLDDEAENGDAVIDFTSTSWKTDGRPGDASADSGAHQEPPTPKEPVFVTAFAHPGSPAPAAAPGPADFAEDETVFEAPEEQITATALDDIETNMGRLPAAPPVVKAGSKSERPKEAVAEEVAEAQPYSWERDNEPRARVWPWALVVLILFIGAVAQGLLWFRHEAVQAVPELRPVLVDVCAKIGCTMGWPRVAEKISIEASDLHPVPGKDGVFELSGTLRNRAEFAQAYPHLEITLTDTFNRALVRKALSPEQWLPSHLRGTEAFALQSDISFSLVLEAPGLPASGYKLYTFYP